MSRHPHVTGKVVLVTGAGGSIGSALCERLLLFAPQRLILLNLTENGLVQTQRHLHSSAGTVVQSVLGSVTDEALLARLLPGVNTVVHAAAHKHVPLGESCPAAFVSTIVGGTRALCLAARRAGVQRIVVISTDKAVHPASVMGASKFMAERLVSGLGAGFLTVRFGNVLGTSGSVLPLWREQIAAGGPITVTDPACTRYFMSVDDACTLILETLAFSVDHGTFVFDMGEPRNLMAMAEELIAESGQPCVIQTTGLRPGEKLTEELTEGPRTATTHSRIFAVPAAPPIAQDDPAILRLIGVAHQADDDAARTRLWQVVTAPVERPKMPTRVWKPKTEPVTFVTWKWRGNDPQRQFLSEHVNVLAAMLQRHYHAPYQLACLTDDPVGLDGSIEVYALPETKGDRLGPPRQGGSKLFPSCYRRLWLFSEEARELGVRLVLLDIDCIILEDITALIQGKTAGFVGWCDVSFGWSKIAGGFWALTAGSHVEVWERFDPRISPALAEEAGHQGSDQAWLSYMLHPPKQVWTSKDGVIKINWLQKSGRHPPEGIKIVFTIGTAPPWDYAMQVGHRWIADHYHL